MNQVYIKGPQCFLFESSILFYSWERLQTVLPTPVPLSRTNARISSQDMRDWKSAQSWAWHIKQNAIQRSISLKYEIVTPLPKALQEYYGCGEGGYDKAKLFFCKMVQSPKHLTRIAQLHNFLNPLATEHCWNIMTEEREVKTSWGHLWKKGTVRSLLTQIV